MKYNIIYLIDLLYNFKEGELEEDLEYMTFVKKVLVEMLNTEIYLTEACKELLSDYIDIYINVESSNKVFTEIIICLIQIYDVSKTYEDELDGKDLRQIYKYAKAFYETTKEALESGYKEKYLVIKLQAPINSVIKTKLHYQFLIDLLQEENIMFAKYSYDDIKNNATEFVFSYDSEYVFSDSFNHNLNTCSYYCINL